MINLPPSLLPHRLDRQATRTDPVSLVRAAGDIQTSLTYSLSLLYGQSIRYTYLDVGHQRSLQSLRCLPTSAAADTTAKAASGNTRLGAVGPSPGPSCFYWPAKRRQLRSVTRSLLIRCG